jgi:hypothetical protein
MMTLASSYVADGYGNRRVIVFDAKTGAYKRHWGAYGTKTPTDEQPPAYKPVPSARYQGHFRTPCTVCGFRAMA